MRRTPARPARTARTATSPGGATIAARPAGFRRIATSWAWSTSSRAPLAGYTSLAFRLAVRGCGGLGLVTTDLVNARSILERRPRAFELAETCAEDRPMAIQLYGHDPSEMARAARWAADRGASA